jgi:hypothetical protein
VRQPPLDSIKPFVWRHGSMDEWIDLCVLSALALFIDAGVQQAAARLRTALMVHCADCADRASGGREMQIELAPTSVSIPFDWTPSPRSATAYAFVPP